MKKKRGWHKPALKKLKIVNGKVEIKGQLYSMSEILGSEKNKFKDKHHKNKTITHHTHF